MIAISHKEKQLGSTFIWTKSFKTNEVHNWRSLHSCLCGFNYKHPWWVFQTMEQWTQQENVLFNLDPTRELLVQFGPQTVFFLWRTPQIRSGKLPVFALTHTNLWGSFNIRAMLSHKVVFVLVILHKELLQKRNSFTTVEVLHIPSIEKGVTSFLFLFL